MAFPRDFHTCLSTGTAGGGGEQAPRWHDGPMADDPRFLTLADVAEVLNTSSAQVYALVRRGDLPAIKIGGRGQWRVERSQLEEFIERMYAETKTFVDQHPFVDSDDRAAPRPDGALSRPCRRARPRRPAPHRRGPPSSRRSRPGRWVRMATISAMPSVTGWSPTAVMTSSFSQPGALGRGVGHDLGDGGARRRRLAARADLGADHGVLRLAGAQDLVDGRATCSIGIAKPTPMLPASPDAPPLVAIAEFTPTTSPARLTSGPPELPGLIAASVCTALM